MKGLILSLMIVIAASPAFSQTDKKLSFSVGPELCFATGSFSSTHSVGVGGTAQAEYHFRDKLKWTATFGLLGYAGKSTTIDNQEYSIPGQVIIPLRVGAKYFLAEGFYGGAQLGVAFLSHAQKGTMFACSPLMLGYEFKTKSEKSFDITIKYDAYTGSDPEDADINSNGTIGSFGLRAAYIF